MFASRGVSVGSGIVSVRHSQLSVSSRFVLSSSLSTGVSCCMILFLDFGWVVGVLDIPASGWFSGGAIDIRSVLCRFFGVRPRLVYLLGVFWLPVVTCAQLARSVFLVGVLSLIVWFGLLHPVGVFCPLDVACA